MARVNNSYTFSIDTDGVTILGAHPKSGLPTVSIQGSCVSPDGDVFDFVATNNLDMRYADRFKVNWNGNKARMPEVAGHGLTDEVKAGRRITTELVIPRGPRISIARKCAQLFPLSRQLSLAATSSVVLADLSVKELKARCQEAGITGYSAKGVRKADLISMIETAV
jgi:hypothetical protein